MLSMEIAEWYCRWRHADRVYVHLDNLPPGRLQWGRINIREALGEVCRSHNLDVPEIKISDALQNNYLETADLKFCNPPPGGHPRLRQLPLSGCSLSNARPGTTEG